MSQNNFPSTLPSIEKLISRINSAEKSQQKDIRITLQEAKDLQNDLALMTARLTKAISEIHVMLKEIRDSSTNIDIKLDGGGFN
jgi:monomeric isocitrate dehydrogenase